MCGWGCIPLPTLPQRYCEPPAHLLFRAIIQSYDMKRRRIHKRHVLFSGTLVLKRGKSVPVSFFRYRTSRYLSRNRNNNNNNSNNNNNNSYNTNNNNINVTPEKRVLTVNVEAGKNAMEEPRPSRLSSNGVSSDEIDVPPSPPIDDTKNFKSAYSQKIKYVAHRRGF